MRGRLFRRTGLLGTGLLLLLPASMAQVVVTTAEARFQVANPEPKGTLLDQARKAADMIKGKTFRYRVFVRPDSDPGLISTILRAPVVSVIRVASLPVAGQKLSVEAVTSGGNNPQGLVFISGQGVSRDENVPLVKPMVEQAYNNIDKALAAVQLAPADVLAVTCYLSSLQDAAAVEELTAARYPKTVQNHLQIPMEYGRALVECEAVARARAPVGFVYPEGLTKSPNFTQVAGVSTRRMLFSSLHTSRGCTDAAIRQMFRGLESELSKNGASIKNVAFSYVYPNSIDGTNLTRAVRFEFYNQQQAPASTLLPFSGFYEKTACTGVELVAPVP